MECNKITINGEEFFFDIKVQGERLVTVGGIMHVISDCHTYFYKEFKKSIHKRMFFKAKEYIVPVYLFKLDYNILDPHYSKIQVTTDIRNAYEQLRAIYNREGEIANCDIILEINL